MSYILKNGISNEADDATRIADRPLAKLDAATIAERIGEAGYQTRIVSS